MSNNFDLNSTAEEAGRAFADQIKGKNVLITGASPGSLGAEAARVISKYANLVIISGRDQSKIDKTAAEIKANVPSANIRTLVFDLSSFTSVRKAAAEVNAYTEPIHVLINNAGVMASPYSLSTDGFESQLAANVLGPFLFTSLIFPKLRASTTSESESPVRIVNISSVGHKFSPFLFDNYTFDEGKTYNKWTAYCSTKAANVLFTNELARRFKEKNLNILAYSLHPGNIETPLRRHVDVQDFIDLGYIGQDGKWAVPTKNVPEGSATHIVAAFDPSIISQSGAYLDDCQVAPKAEHVTAEADGKRLWELSEKLTGQKFEI